MSVHSSPNTSPATSSDAPQNLSCDICIIGGGSGGLSVAAGAAQMGACVILFEQAEMGGDCLNAGCVPSKALLAASKAAKKAAGAPQMGIHQEKAPDIDYQGVLAHIRAVIETIAPHDSVERFEGLGVHVIQKPAKLSGPQTVASLDDTIQVQARFIVIASGSRAFIPPVAGLDKLAFLTNEEIFNLAEKPSHLLIMGGGPIGIEMAMAHARLGIKVSLVEGLSILPKDEPELVDILRAQLISEDISLYEGVFVKQASQDEKGAITLTLEDGRKVTGSHLLVAAGRRPSLTRLNLDAGQVKTEKGAIKTDQRLRTTNKRIFAIGDVAGRHQFTHMAGAHASIVIRNILFKLPAKIDERAVPWVTYCDPELAHCGLSEAEARKALPGQQLKIVSWHLDNNDRAVAEANTAGMVKLIADQKGRLIGGAILAPDAGEMIGLIALAIQKKMKLSSLAGLTLPYPTKAEAIKRAAGSAYTDILFSTRTKKLIGFLLRLFG